MADPAALPNVSAEFEDAELGDARRTRRLRRMAEMALRAPGLSFPKMARSEGELEGVYRFFANQDFDWHAVFAPHRERTAERCRARSEVIVVHDTTPFEFETDEARDLGLLSDGSSGFYGHFSLALGDENSRSMLGVLGFEPLSRRSFATSLKRHSRAEQNRILAKKPQAEKEHERWYRGVSAAEETMGGGCSLIHVMDREADAYVLWSRLVEEKRRFVIRAISGSPLRVRRIERALHGVDGQLLREVPLKRRPEKSRRRGKRPARAARLATLHYRAGGATIRRPEDVIEAPEAAAVNVVDVYEPNPPQGEEPLRWTLLTSEPIDTAEQVARIVDLYRARWTIEEYFKALKTGCAYETRQLETLEGLLKALAFFIPLAWRMLLLRSAARDAPEAPVGELLDADELRLLKRLSVRVKLPDQPTLEQALNAVAGLGGHLKRNGQPGWQTLVAGYRELRTAMIGYLAAREM